MHEYGIVQSILGLVDDQVRGHAGKRATRVVLAVEGGHVDERFLRDAFDTFKVETSACDAELIVMQAALQVWCPDCGSRSTVAARDSACPRCGSPSVQLASSDEIYLQSVEIEV